MVVLVEVEVVVAGVGLVVEVAEGSVVGVAVVGEDSGDEDEGKQRGWWGIWGIWWGLRSVVQQATSWLMVAAAGNIQI